MRDHGTLTGKTFQMKQVLPVSFKSYHANICILYRQRLKRYSTSLIGEMKIWMTQNYNILLTRLTKISTSLRYTLLTELWIHIFLVGMQNGTMHRTRILQFLYNRVRMTLWLSNCIFKINLLKNRPLITNVQQYSLWHYANSKNIRTKQFPLVGNQLNKLWYVRIIEHNAARKRTKRDLYLLIWIQLCDVKLGFFYKSKI